MSQVRIEHVALWVEDLDGVCAFYEHFFGAEVGPRYVNEAKGFASRFLRWDGAARLEVMTRRDVVQRGVAAGGGERLGLAHVALGVGNEDEVRRVTDAVRAAGYVVCGEPRRTGDGYYESVVLDPEGNRVELVATA
jgi:lactoylglutathione lyase